MAEQPELTKSQIYGQPPLTSKKAVSPLVGAEDVERIQEIRGQRLQQEQIRKLKRDAEPIKNKNIKEIQSTIQSYQNNLAKNQQRVERLKERERREDDPEAEERLEERIELTEAEIEGQRKALGELRKYQQKYQEYDYKKVLANKKYANKVRDYADDLSDSYVKRERQKIRNKKLVEKNKEEFKEKTGLTPEQFKQFSNYAQAMILKKAEGLSTEQARKEIQEEAYDEIIKEELGVTNLKQYSKGAREDLKERAIKKVRQREQKETEVRRDFVAYKNIITGQKMSIRPGETIKNPLLVPIKVTASGQELPASEQVKLQLERPELFGTIGPSEVDKVIDNVFQVARYVPQKIQEGFMEFRERVGRGVDRGTIESNQKAISSLIKIKIMGVLSPEAEKKVDKKLQELRQEQLQLLILSEQDQISAKGQIAGLTTQIALDVFFPVLGALDVGSLISIEALKIMEQGAKTYDDVLKGEITKDEIKAIHQSSVVTNIPISVANNISRNIKEKGFVEGIKDSSKDAYASISEFFTKADMIDKMKKKRKKIIEIKKDLQKDKNNYEPMSYSNAIREIDNSLSQVDRNIETIKRQRLVQNVGTGLILTSMLGAGAYGATRRRIRNVELAKYDDAIKRYNALKKIAKEDVRLQYSSGGEQITSYTGNFGRIDDMGFLKSIKNWDDVQRIDIAKNSQAYVARKTIFKKIEVPKSIKKISKGKNNYYLTYLPEALPIDEIRRLTASQINSMPGHSVYYKNAITYNVRFKDGSVKSFSALARSNKPLPNFRNPLNAIKYGADRKIVLSKKLTDEVIQSNVFRLRGGRAIPEQTLLSRGRDTVETRRLSQAAGAVSAEDYWGISSRQAVTRRTQRGTRTTQDLTSLSPEGFFFGTETRRVARTRTVSTPVTIDTGYLQLALRNKLDALKRLKATKKTVKLTTEQEALSSLSSKLDNAVSSGKRTIKLKPELVNKLSPEDLATVRGAVSSVQVSPPRARATALPESIKNTSSTISKRVNAISSNLTKTSQDINKLINKIENERFLGRITKTKAQNYKKQIDNLISKVKSQEKQAESTATKTRTLMRELQKQRQKISSAVLSTELNKQSQRVSQLQQLQQRYRLKLRQLQMTQTEISQVIQPSQAVGIRTTTPGTRIPRIPRIGFGSGKERKPTEGKKPDYRAYIPQVRRKGEWESIGRADYKWKSAKKAIQETGTELSQSWRLFPTGTRLPKKKPKEINRKGYYKKKEKGFNVWIEKPKYKIDTPEEKKALKKARKKSKKKKQFRKKVDKYWGIK